jgi:hypothetical protein
MAVLIAWTVGLGGEAHAAPNLNARLHGDYAINATLACVQNQLGFGPGPDLELLGPANTRTITVHGVLTFNGDGTGTVQARSLAVLHSQAFLVTGGQPVGESEFSGDVSYTVNPDGTFTAELAVSGQVLSGISAGLTLDISDIVRQGRIAQGGRALIISNTVANVETVVIGATTFKRICGRAGAALKIK